MRMDLKEQYFGTEIEMTGLTREHAAQVVAELFGTSVYYRHSYDSWRLLDREGKEWKFVYDSSISAQRRAGGRMVPTGSEYCTEMVSPKLTYEEMGKLQEVEWNYPNAASTFLNMQKKRIWNITI